MAEPIVETKYGKLKGKVAQDYKGGKYYSFQGIPYAKPPIGNLRFKCSEPPEKWQGIRDATKEANGSLSIHFVVRERVVGSEDCLYLNVYTPQLPSGNKPALKPVMFWIHGGGFHYGSGASDFFGPDYIITGDVVLVTINYRLGALGFLSLEDPSLGVTGNAGLKDMVLALRWVKENIQKFGGDPNNVTLFGESAGGVSVHLLMLSPMSKGLFHRGIIQSGSALNPWIFSKTVSAELATVLKLNTTNEKELLDHLRKIPAERFIQIQEEIPFVMSSSCNEIRAFSFIIEKPSTSEPNFLTEHPLDIMASGNYHKVPLIIGYAEREGMLTEISHVKRYGSLQVPTDLSTRIPFYYNIPKDSEQEKNIVQKIKKFYFDDKEPSAETEDEFLELEGDVFFLRGIYVAIKEMMNNLNFPIYLYRVTADTTLNLFKNIANVKRRGTCHYDMVGYLFPTEHTPKFEANSKEGKCVETIVTLWTNFAKNANPNSDKIKITWDPIQKDTYNYLDIGLELKPGKSPDVERLKFWDEISANVNSKM